MIGKNSLVLYKRQPAVVQEIDGDKFLIEYCTNPGQETGKKAVFSTQKVRAKDFILLEEKVSSINNVLNFDKNGKADVENLIKEAHELLQSDEENADKPVSFADLKDLVSSGFDSDGSWFLFSLIEKSAEFELSEDAFKLGRIEFIPQSFEKIEEFKKKAFEKENAAALREEFLKRLKLKKLNLPDDAKFMVDVEALALGKTDKSKTLQDAKIAQSPENAHKILLDCGIWDITRNPYPVRWGLSIQSASETLASPPEEQRFEVSGISYAIDSEHSTDPDDAIAWDGNFLWVHIADPASTVFPGSSIDIAARNRGATLYIPEGASRMLCESCLSDYALGLTEKSRALSFKIKLDSNGAIENCEVLKTIINVSRLTYSKAEELKDSPELKPLFEIARKNIERRNNANSVSITLPEVHISVDKQTKKVSITQEVHLEADEVVREAMLLAGEGAAKFAFKNNIAFPFVSQEKPEIPSDLPESLAGQYRLRRCMRKRNVGVTPAPHAALGLSMYSQVTSPLRRYGDLVAHQQLRAFIEGKPLLDKDTMLERISAGDAAASACKRAERNSNLHWTLVYLLQNPDWNGKAVCVEHKGKQSVFLIPELGMETLLIPAKQTDLNQEIQVCAGKIDIVNLSASFRQI